jgi:multidrug resistance efflux pump
MRFRRPAITEATQSKSVDPSDLQGLRRRRVLGRYIVGLAVILIGISMWYADNCWVSADGIIAGELAPVTPISQARVKRLDAHCLDYVTRGQVIARLENEFTLEASAQQVQQLRLELARAVSDVEVATKEADAAGSYHAAQVAVLAQMRKVFKSESSLRDEDYVADLVFQKARADMDKAEADTAAADFVTKTKLEDKKRAEESVKLLTDRLASFQSSPELMGAYDLVAPKAGYLTECSAQVGQVVNTTTKLYEVFNPLDAFAVAFMSPNDAIRVKGGDRVEMTVGGVPGKIKAEVVGFYPELSGLPTALTRYFWEQEKWAQFEPVRLNFVDLTDDQRRHLKASAQISISLWRRPTRGLLGQVGRIVAFVGSIGTLGRSEATHE